MSIAGTPLPGARHFKKAVKLVNSFVNSCWKLILLIYKNAQTFKDNRRKAVNLTYASRKLKYRHIHEDNDSADHTADHRHQ